MRLRCGECGLVREVEVTDEEAQRFDRELDRGLDEIAAAVVRLDRERMIAEADAITAALEHDLIDPGDFSRKDPLGGLPPARLRPLNGVR
jgi:hypothetical protein